MRPDDDLATTLTQLGADDGPPVDPVFANRLDSALRSAHAEQPTEPRHRSIWVPVTAGLAAAGAIIVAVMIVMASLNGAVTDEVVMTAASGTDVVMPGESAVVGAPGLRLPDGTRISVGPDGEAVVDGVVLGPGAEAVVIGGRLEVIDVDPGYSDRANPPLPSMTTVPPAARPSGDAAPSTDRPGPGSTSLSTVPPATDATRSDGADGRRDPTGSTTETPTSTTGDGPTTSTTGDTQTTQPRPTSTTRATAPPSSTAGQSTTATNAPRPASMALTATPVPQGRVRLEWALRNIDGAAGTLAGFRVKATVGDRSSTLVVIRATSARSTTIERLAASDVTFWVEAIDNAGRVIVASEAVSQPAR